MNADLMVLAALLHEQEKSFRAVVVGTQELAIAEEAQTVYAAICRLESAALRLAKTSRPTALRRTG